ncbi:MAG: serine hydrolase domain-containing protein [Planctomycetota bacterium]
MQVNVAPIFGSPYSMSPVKALLARSWGRLWLAIAFFWFTNLIVTAVNPAKENCSRQHSPIPTFGAVTANRERQELSCLIHQQELLPHRSGGWVFPANNPPRLVWRDAEEIRRLEVASPPPVRWFDTHLREARQPDHSGRWIAWVEGRAPNGLPLRRAHTFFCLPETIDPSVFPDLTIRFPNFPSPHTAPLLREYQSEIERTAKELFGKAVFDQERAAIVLAALYESQPLGRPRRFAESALAQNAEHHLALKLKLLGLEQKVRSLALPSDSEDQPPAAEAARAKSLTPEQLAAAKQKIDTFCQEWCTATGEPFVIKLVLDGQEITHAAFGSGSDGEPIGLDYRCWIASLTKTVTGLMVARFLDQGLLQLDDSIATVFPDYPQNDPHVPTFRQCLNHTAGFAGHGDFGGMYHPHFENVILNAIELNQPGKVHRYSGSGYELVAKAMELIAGQPAVQLYAEQLFEPLGCGDAVLGNASSDAELTAEELARLGELLAHRGQSGGKRFFRPETLDLLLPQDLQVEAAPPHGYGVGLHWVYHRRVGAPTDSGKVEDLLFSPRTVGHGSLSGCILMVDLDRRLVVTQARRQFKEADNEWYVRFFQVVAEALEQK